MKYRYLIDSYIIYNTFCVTTFENNSIYIENNAVINSSYVYHSYSDANFITFYLITIGSGLENEVNSLRSNNQITQSYIVNEVASFFTEYLADKLNNILKLEANKKGYNLLLRLSPGYRDFSLSFQKTIIDILDKDRNIVSLTSNNYLVPMKSTTGIIGWTNEKTNQIN